MKNGDLLHAAHGHALISMQATMDAYRALRGAAKITLKLTRRGEPMELVLHLKPE